MALCTPEPRRCVAPERRPAQSQEQWLEAARRARLLPRLATPLDVKDLARAARGAQLCINGQLSRSTPTHLSLWPPQAIAAAGPSIKTPVRRDPCLTPSRSARGGSHRAPLRSQWARRASIHSSHATLASAPLRPFARERCLRSGWTGSGVPPRPTLKATSRRGGSRRMRRRDHSSKHRGSAHESRTPGGDHRPRNRVVGLPSLRD